MLFPNVCGTCELGRCLFTSNCVGLGRGPCVGGPLKMRNNYGVAQAGGFAPSLPLASLWPCVCQVGPRERRRVPCLQVGAQHSAGAAGTGILRNFSIFWLQVGKFRGRFCYTACLCSFPVRLYGQSCSGDRRQSVTPTLVPELGDQK